MIDNAPIDYAPLATDADDPDLASTLAAAMELHRRELFAEAEGGYLRVLAVSPNHPVALGRLGRIHLETNRPYSGGLLLQRAHATLGGPQVRVSTEEL